MSFDENPFASPTVEATLQPVGVDDASDAVRIRRQYIKHEASVKSVGVLYYLGAIGGGFGIAMSIVEGIDSNQFGAGLSIAAICATVAAVFVLLGVGMRKLARWVRIPVGLLSVVGLLNFPFGTLINAYILYLVFGAKGNVVFSPEYQEVIRRTPHVKYKTSPVVVVLLVILLAFLAIAIAGPLLFG